MGCKWGRMVLDGFCRRLRSEEVVGVLRRAAFFGGPLELGGAVLRVALRSVFSTSLAWVLLASCRGLSPSLTAQGCLPRQPARTWRSSAPPHAAHDQFSPSRSSAPRRATHRPWRFVWWVSLASCRGLLSSLTAQGCLLWQPARTSRSSAPRRATRDRCSPTSCSLRLLWLVGRR